MIELLKAIQQELRAKLPYIREMDIYITPHIGFIPQGVMQPCIGIKDGRVRHSYGAGHSKEYELDVRLAILEGLSGQEASIVGNPASDGKGVLDIEADCVAALDCNTLGVKGIISARIVDCPGSEFFNGKNGPELQRKQLGLKYEKQVIP